MSEKGKKQNNLFYIALCCCVGVIGITGYFANRKEKQDAKTSTDTVLQLPEPTKAPEKTEEQKNTPLPTLSPVVNTPKAEEVISEVSGEEIIDVIEIGEDETFFDGKTVESVSINEDPDFILPADGAIGESFSGNTLIYNETMDDWRTHNGIDILAKAGSEVLAAEDGAIEAVYADYMGNTVIIDHKNGFKTKYSGLSETQNLELDKKVKKGDLIGFVAEEVFGENETEPHLHFEVIKDDKHQNPEDFIE